MKTIKTETHLFWVDENVEPNDRERCVSYNKDTGEPVLDSCYFEEDASYYVYKPSKIIAASPKLGDLPEFATLPPTEYDVEKLACEKLGWNYELYKSRKETQIPFNEVEISAWIKGYKAAKSERGFSKEWDFVPEMIEDYEIDSTGDRNYNKGKQPKIVNGKIQGTWQKK